MVTSECGGDDKLRGGDSVNGKSDMGLGNLNIWRKYTVSDIVSRIATKTEPSEDLCCMSVRKQGKHNITI